MAFTYVQSALGSAAGGSGICSVTITGVGAGNLLIVDTITALQAGFTITGVTASDAASKYTLTPQSPVTFSNGTVQEAQAIAYLLSSPAGSHTITVTWTISGGVNSNFNFCNLNVFEFSYTGTIILDKDAIATFPSSTGHSPITSPSITPTIVGSLLFGVWFADAGTEQGANSPWVQPGSATQEAYILSSLSGATAANFKESVDPDSQSAIIASFGANYITSAKWGLS